ncbi:porin [Acidocella sp.]|uniref:porin n=1 Tax=Acidocella sp. TaxID=50710 RepID=UPI00262D967A|nr:porin [Acidocella sp.]
MAATILSGAAMTSLAHADVTLYPGNGPVPSINIYLRVDAGLRLDSNVDLSQYNSQTGKTTLVQAGGNDWGTSMFGVYGSSKLGDNITGIYKVESGFNATNGTFNSSTNSIFNRRAYVGLKNQQFGTIMLGKDLFIDNDVYNFDPMIQENMSTATLVYGRNWGGASDMVEYRSPALYGLHLGLMAAFDNGSGYYSTRVSNAYGVSGEYDIGDLSLYGIYDEVQDTHGHYTNLYSASKEWIAGATYNFQPVEFFAGIEGLSAPNGAQADGGTPIQNPGAPYAPGSAGSPYAAVYATSAYMGWLGAVWSVSQHVTLRGAWYHTSINDHGGNASLFTAGGEYSFTPNLLLYATAGEVVNSGHADFSADIYSPPAAPGHNQFAGFVGASIKF